MSDTAALRRRFERLLSTAPAGLVAFAACDSHETKRDEEVVAAGIGLPPRESASDHDREHDDDHDHDGDDHDAIERERCPSGKWCGDPEAAMAFSVPSDPLSLGCPPRLVPNPNNGVDPLDERYEGLSLSIDMRAELDRERTVSAHDLGNDICCYDWLDHCVGRAYVAEGRALAPSADGFTGARGSLEAWARSLVDDAAHELASVASFSRLVLELLAVGAPSQLILDAQRAALDEVRHAEACLDLAASVLSVRPRFGRLPALPPRAGGLVRLAVDTFVEGVVGESIAAILGAREAESAPHDRARVVLREIAGDESDHALSSLRVLVWAAARAPDVLPAIRRSDRAIAHHLETAFVDGPSVPFRVTPRMRREVALEVYRDVVRPCVRHLCA